MIQWQSVQHKNPYLSSHPAPSHVNRWSRPEDGWLKCNLDAAIFGNSRSVGLGCIIRDSGCFVAARSINVQELFASHLAEALSFREALSWVKALPLNSITLKLIA